MILVQLNGGLGNQLFQYALGRRMSLDRNTELRFDICAFKGQNREYKLQHFKVVGSPTSPAEIGEIFRQEKHPLSGIIHGFWEARKPYSPLQIIDEQGHDFDERILKAPNNVFLRGYWQSEKYFKEIKDVLIREIQLKSPLDSQNKQIAQRIEPANSVSVHIRRGDYVNDPAVANVLGPLPLEYYYEAIEIIQASIPNPSLFVFSDDILWAKQNLTVDIPITFVDINTPDTDYEDIHLMSLCKHHIIANSSFSWWGAWLNPKPEKLVVAPKKWFKKEISNTGDLIPSSWYIV
jgi:hypothetical protein